MAELSKYAASPGIFYLKSAIHKEMPNANTNQVGSNFRWQPTSFDNPGLRLFYLSSERSKLDFLNITIQYDFFQRSTNNQIGDILKGLAPFLKASFTCG